MMKVVNVASVPQRSPFRYPGGKTWLVPTIREWLRSQDKRIRELIEPFAGGGIVSLTAVFENLVDRATMVEIDPDIAAVWRTILNGQGTWLANEIARFEVTKSSVDTRLRKGTGNSLRERAFGTILRNRINRGGILAPGAGKVKRGENGKGLKSRWYPETLKNRILRIVEKRNRLCFIQGDGAQILRESATRENVVYFIDPPYTGTGKRLYAYFDVNHADLFRLAERLSGDFLMTYDDSKEIRLLAGQHGFEIYEIPMKSSHHTKKIELLIGRCLDWLRTDDLSFL